MRAYCGVSEGAKKTSSIVAQLGRRQPLVKNPVRAGFQTGGTKPTFASRGRVVDLVNDAGEGEEDQESK
jgi:hypothetical protein